MPGNQVVNDEIVLTFRLRCAAPDVVAAARHALVTELPALVRGLGLAARPGDVDLAGIELSLPDFQPSRYQPADTVDRDALGRILAWGLGTDGAHHKQHALEQIAERLGLDIAGGEEAGDA
jgi:hypothetical protein